MLTKEKVESSKARPKQVLSEVQEAKARLKKGATQIRQSVGSDKRSLSCTELGCREEAPACPTDSEELL